MSKLKTTFELLGYTNVTTYINSGNVIFNTKKTSVDNITKEIQQIILKNFNLKIPVVIRDKKNIITLCKKIPDDWMNDKEHKTDVMFLWDKYANKNVLKEIATNPVVDSLVYISGAIVWRLRKEDYGKSKMNDIIGTDVYKNMTVRNVNTVRKLYLLLND